MVDIAGGKMLRAFGHNNVTNYDILDIDGSSLTATGWSKARNILSQQCCDMLR